MWYAANCELSPMNVWWGKDGFKSCNSFIYCNSLSLVYFINHFYKSYCENDEIALRRLMGLKHAPLNHLISYRIKWGHFFYVWNVCQNDGKWSENGKDFTFVLISSGLFAGWDEVVRLSSASCMHSAVLQIDKSCVSVMWRHLRWCILLFWRRKRTFYASLNCPMVEERKRGRERKITIPYLTFFTTSSSLQTGFHPSLFNISYELVPATCHLLLLPLWMKFSFLLFSWIGIQLNKNVDIFILLLQQIAFEISHSINPHFHSKLKRFNLVL